MTRVVAYVPDLMDRSRLSAAATEVTFVPQPDALAEAAGGADVVVVDLTRPGVLEALRTIDTRVVGFANHTERELMASARAAGCETVLARSAFFSRIPELLA